MHPVIGEVSQTLKERYLLFSRVRASERLLIWPSPPSAVLYEHPGQICDDRTNHGEINCSFGEDERGRMAINLVVAVTDDDWFEMLRRQPGLDEVNFWAPSGANFRALQPGE